MSKITLNPIIGSYASVIALNNRFQQIEDAFNDDVLWRGGFTGNSNEMSVDFDMNGFNILNQANPVTLTGGFNWLGDWVLTTDYAVGDAVHHAGVSYVCILPSLNNEPPNITYWQILAEASLPSQTGNANKILVTDGVTASWESRLERFGTTNFSYILGGHYATIDETAGGSYCFDGRNTWPNKIGINNTRPVSEPPSGARIDDTGYVAGVASVSAILAGYDNICNVSAGMIASQHSMIYSLSDHASIFGGSLHTIEGDAEYASVLGGTDNKIEERGRYSVILGGNANLIETGVSDAQSGFRATILGGSSNTAGGRNAVILNGDSNRIDATYGTIINGESVTITAGSHVVAAGASHIIGASLSADYSAVFGLTNIVDASRCFVYGEGNTIGGGHSYSSAMGLGTKTPTLGTHVQSARQRDSVVGNNQSLQWTCSQETIDTTTTRLSLSGSTNYPRQPEDSIVNGTVYVVGVRESDGVESSFHIDFTSRRVGSATPILTYNNTITRNNGLSLTGLPTMSVTTSDIYRVEVVGIVATNINWDAAFYGHQIVYTP